jgi:hypothetical protein
VVFRLTAYVLDPDGRVVKDGFEGCGLIVVVSCCEHGNEHLVSTKYGGPS